MWTTFLAPTKSATASCQRYQSLYLHVPPAQRLGPQAPRERGASEHALQPRASLLPYDSLPIHFSIVFPTQSLVQEPKGDPQYAAVRATMEVAPSNGPVAVPRDSEGLQAYNDSRPIQAYSDNRPTQAYEDARPTHAYDDVRPAQSYEDKRPIQAYSDENPSVRGYAKSPHATQPGYQAVGVDEDSTHKRLCGLRPVTFWLSAALVFAMVALGAMAGGLGSGMKSANDRAIYW